MDQIEVEVRGSINPWRWSPRVFSIHAPRGVVAISRKGHPEDWSYRCVHVTNVQMWPHYASKHIHNSMDSMEAMLTMRVQGSEVRAMMDVVDHPRSPVQQVRGFTQRGFHVGSHAWMIRFFSYECLERAVKLLQSIREGVFVEEEDTENVPCASEVNATGKHDRVAEAAATEIDADHRSATADGDDTDRFAAPPAASASLLMQKDSHCTEHSSGSALTSMNVIDGDVAADMANIRAAWEHVRRGMPSVTQQ